MMGHRSYPFNFFATIFLKLCVFITFLVMVDRHFSNFWIFSQLNLSNTYYHNKNTEYRPRRWLSEETKNIPLENEEILKDPRIIKHKMPPDTEMPKEKTHKPCEDPKPTACSNYKEEEKTQNIQNIPENPTDPTSTVEGVILHITDSELNLFPDITEDPTNAKIIEDCTNKQDKRRVT